jgi:hypothetical protein
MAGPADPPADGRWLDILEQGLTLVILPDCCLKVSLLLADVTQCHVDICQL